MKEEESVNVVCACVRVHRFLKRGEKNCVHACVHVRVSFLYHSLPTVVEEARGNVRVKKDKRRKNSANVCVRGCVYILSVHNVHRNIGECVFLFDLFVCQVCACVYM